MVCGRRHNTSRDATGIRLQVQVLTIDVGQCGLRHRGAEGTMVDSEPYLQAIDDRGMRPARQRWRFRFAAAGLRSAGAKAGETCGNLVARAFVAAHDTLRPGSRQASR